MAQKKAGRNPKEAKLTKEKKGKKDSKEKTIQGRSVWMETVFPLVLFGITLVLFLNFAGFINLPYLDFSSPNQAGGEAVVEKGEELADSQLVPEATYPGPTLDAVEPEETEKVKEQDEAATPLSEEEVLLTGEVQPPASQAPETNEEEYRRLAKIYSEMKPEEAVRIMDNLPDQEVVEILSFMKEREVADILSLMEPEQAADLLQKMVEGR